MDPADLSVGADMPRMNHLDHEPDQRTAAQKKRPVSLPGPALSHEAKSQRIGCSSERGLLSALDSTTEPEDESG